MAKWFIGWMCERCKGYLSREWKPWDCPVCGKEICDRCGWMMDHCKSCSEGKTELELAIVANKSGEFNFELTEL